MVIEVSHLFVQVVKLSGVGEVLIPAAATMDKVGTGGLGIFGALADNIQDFGFSIPGFDLCDAGFDLLTGQSVFDKDDEVIEMRHALSAIGEIVNGQFYFLMFFNRFLHRRLVLGMGFWN